MGCLLLTFQIYRILSLSSIKWYLTQEDLVISRGFIPGLKTFVQIPLYNIYSASSTNNFLGHFLKFGGIQIRTTDGVASGESEAMMKDAVSFQSAINELVQTIKRGQLNATPNTVAYPSSTLSHFETEIRRLYELKQQGLLTEEEFGTMKKKLLN